jgi:hypothetical protein
MSVGIINESVKSSFGEPKFESAKFPWKQVKDLGRLWRRDEDRIDCMNHAIRPKL